ncbi:unnamed protein product, partial [Amoebophrya sp. A25]
NFGAHSFRKGGASAAALSGEALSEILTAGAWSEKSSAGKCYGSLSELQGSGIDNAAKLTADTTDQLEAIGAGEGARAPL